MKTPVHPLGYRGRHLGRIRTESATVALTDYVGGLALPAHAHAEPNLCAVLRGDFRERWGAHGVELAPGYVLAKPAGTEHSNEFGRLGARCLNIDLAPGLGETLDASESGLHAPRIVRDPRAGFLCRELAAELERPDDLTALAVEAGVLGLVATFARVRRQERAASVPTWLAQARELVSARAAEPLRIHGIAQELGVSPSHLARAFQREFRCSLAEYIRRCRVERAAQALCAPDASLAEVAQRAGFCDQSHFCRVFKRVTGMTPGAWRQRLGSPS